MSKAPTHTPWKYICFIGQHIPVLWAEARWQRFLFHKRFLRITRTKTEWKCVKLISSHTRSWTESQNALFKTVIFPSKSRIWDWKLSVVWWMPWSKTTQFNSKITRRHPCSPIKMVFWWRQVHAPAHVHAPTHKWLWVICFFLSNSCWYHEYRKVSWTTFKKHTSKYCWDEQQYTALYSCAYKYVRAEDKWRIRRATNKILNLNAQFGLWFTAGHKITQYSDHSQSGRSGECASRHYPYFGLRTYNSWFWGAAPNLIAYSGSLLNFGSFRVFPGQNWNSFVELSVLSEIPASPSLTKILNAHNST